MPPRANLISQRFSKLVVKEVARDSSRVRWKCLCDCGNWSIVSTDHLRSGHSKSCGCLNVARTRVMGKANRMHGHTAKGKPSATFYSWSGMRTRCENPKAKGYHNYGGRGIKICDRWKNFSNFLADMGARPKGKQIDRIDNDGDYTPANCRWVTRIQQARNRRTNTHLTIDGETHTIVEWAEISGIPVNVVYLRLKNHWPTNKLFKSPRSNHHITVTIKGETRMLSEWAELSGIKWATLHKRLRHWHPDKLLTPTGVTRNNGSKRQNWQLAQSPS